MADTSKETAGWFGITMKPLIGLAIQEAVKLAFIDSVIKPGYEPGDDRTYPTDEERRAWLYDIDSMPDEVLATAHPAVVARNASTRLLGTGGWTVNGVYAGNASPQQILNACIDRPDHDPLDEFQMGLLDMGLKPTAEDDEQGDG